MNIEYILDTIRRNGFSPKLVDTYHNGTRTIKFKRGPLIYRVDPTSPPFLWISTGCQMSHETDDINLLHQAANEVNDSVCAGKVVVLDYSPIVCFNQETLCDSNSYFEENFELFMKIIDTTIDKFLEIYDILKDKDKKIQEEFTRALEPKGQDELPF